MLHIALKWWMWQCAAHFFKFDAQLYRYQLVPLRKFVAKGRPYVIWGPSRTTRVRLLN
jgi:hypothetical protein